jgi:hypothetical protein
MMAFKNEFENKEDEYPGVGDKFGFITKHWCFFVVFRTINPCNHNYPGVGQGVAE